MKERLIAIRDKIDAISVRERVMIFSAAVGVMVFVMMSLVLSPLYARERTLQAQIAQQRNMIGGIDAEITAVVESYATDPDAPARARLVAIQGETATMAQAMRANETGLIAPQQIAPLLETILKSNGHLRLVDLTTLPVRPVNESIEAAPPVAAPAQPKPPQGDQMLASVLKAQDAAAPRGAGTPEAVPLLYRHGVELTVARQLSGHGPLHGRAGKHAGPPDLGQGQSGSGRVSERAPDADHVHPQSGQEMDATVSPRTLFLVAMAWAGAVNAAPEAGLPDPTRPPAMLPARRHGQRAHCAGAAAAAIDPDRAATRGPTCGGDRWPDFASGRQIPGRRAHQNDRYPS